MGVNELWNIIGSSGEIMPIDRLQNKKVAIDLSGWIVESMAMPKANQAQQNMYLRNIFCRASKMLRKGIIPVFVLEGQVPELKQAVMNERNDIRQGKDRKTDTIKKVGRSRFNGMLRNCKKLLELMGLTCIQADGEAEAMCAYLDENDLVDGCITEDGDCFLYGAKTIYRKFNLTNGTLEKYSLDKIENLYRLGRQKMIALALLCGCDYNSGVVGVGKIMAMKFFNLVDDEDVLQTMRSWKDSYRKLSKEEEAVKSRCNLIEDFPNENVIDEFLRKGKTPKKIESWSHPNGPDLAKFLIKFLKWEMTSVLPKTIELVAAWQVLNFESNSATNKDTIGLLIPQKIKKNSIQMSIPRYEILWKLNNKDEYSKICVTDEDKQELEKEFSTFEPKSEVMKSYPNLITDFENSKLLKKAGGKSKKPKAKNNKENDAQEQDGIPQVKRNRITRKKNDGNQRIDEIFQIKKTTTVKKSSKTINKHLEVVKVTEPKATTGLNIHSRLNDSIDEIINNFTENDFDTDVDLDASDISIIIDKICNKGTSHVNIPTSPESLKPQSSSSPLLEDSFDEVGPYIPLAQRIY